MGDTFRWKGEVSGWLFVCSGSIISGSSTSNSSGSSSFSSSSSRSSSSSVYMGDGIINIVMYASYCYAYYTLYCTYNHTLQYTILYYTQNVATTEVAEALSSVPGFSDVTVFGVPVPHCDGKVGMAAVVLADGVSERYLTQCCMMGLIEFILYVIWVLLSLCSIFYGFY